MNYKKTFFNTKRSHLSLFLFLIVLAVLLLLFNLGAGLDLQFSKAVWSGLNHPKKAGSLLSDILCNVGFFFAFTIIISFAICSFVYKKKKVWVPVLCCILCGVVLGCFIYFEHDSFFKIIKTADEDFYSSMSEAVRWTLMVLVWLVVLTGSFLFSWFFICKRVNKRLMVRAGLFLIIGGALILLGVDFLKVIWSRPRPYLVMGDSGLDVDYQPVWLPQPFKCFDTSVPDEIRGGLKSFPSGHTANAMIMVLSVVSLTSLDIFKTKKTKYIYLFSSFAIVLIVAFGRIMGRYHFLTDVSAAMIIGWIVSFFMPWCYKKENGKLLW